MTAKSRLLGVAAVVLSTIAAVACGHSNPLGPSTCQDPLANNYGQPGTCTYTAPTESYVKVVSTSPAAGSTLDRTSQEVYATIEYGISKADSERGCTLYITAWLSVDGVNPVPSQAPPQAIGGTYGTVPIHLGVNSTLNPPVAQTNFLTPQVNCGTGTAAQPLLMGSPFSVLYYWK